MFNSWPSINGSIQRVSDGSKTILSNIEHSNVSFELECVYLLVIELEHPIFGFEQWNIELRT